MSPSKGAEVTFPSSSVPSIADVGPFAELAVVG